MKKKDFELIYEKFCDLYEDDGSNVERLEKALMQEIGKREGKMAICRICSGEIGENEPILYICCPFCGDNDFDLIGLKIHLSTGWCDEFNNLEVKSIIQWP